MSKPTRDAVVADIGETHMRFAVSNIDKLTIDHYVQFCNDAFRTVAEALAAYLQSIPGPPHATSLAITHGSGPENRHDLAVGDIEAVTASRPVCIIDALDALALALPELAPHDIEQIGGKNAGLYAEKAVISVGQALGVATANPIGGSWTTFHANAGNISFAPQTWEEFNILERIRCDTGHVSVEHLLSSPGLTHLYELLLETSGQPVRSMPATEIVDSALNANDTLAANVLNYFATWLGRFAGDIALVYGARGGIYIWGAIPRRMESVLNGHLFRSAFEAKGGRSAYLAEIPAFLIRSEDTVLRGAAMALSQHVD